MVHVVLPCGFQLEESYEDEGEVTEMDDDDGGGGVDIQHLELVQG